MDRQETLKEQSIKLAAEMLMEARSVRTSQESKKERLIAKMLKDPLGKTFTLAMTDQCFRSNSASRAADQLRYLLERYGVPKFAGFVKRFQLKLFELFSPWIPDILMPIVKKELRCETSMVVISGEERDIIRHIQERKKEGVRTNLNHLGEAILGEEEAKRRLQVYINDLSAPEIDYVSVKISTICSQLNLLDWEGTCSIVKERLASLFRAAMLNQYEDFDGKKRMKFVNLDMEEYRYLLLSVEVFKRVLDDPEFYHYSAGIALQSYIPDSFKIQMQLTEWALERVRKGGAPIKIRIVKGANLAMESVESSLNGWPLPIYSKKCDADANFKRMVSFAMDPERAKAVHVGIASHNLFDIAYSLLLSKNNAIEENVSFEMLEGMANNMRRVVQKKCREMVLYCPAAKEKEFVNAVAYLVRRLDENTDPENFLRYIFDMSPGSKEWKVQAQMFCEAFDKKDAVALIPFRTQDRNNEKEPAVSFLPFENECPTDFSLEQNRKWIEGVIDEWKHKEIADIPVCIGGEEIFCKGREAIGRDPSAPNKALYRYTLCDEELVEKAIKTALEASERWSHSDVNSRSLVLFNVANQLRKNRGDLIAAMVADGGKTVFEADVEVCEAIDFCEYYRRNMEELDSLQDIEWQAKGIVLVTPPWNFPLAIPLGGILAALVTGNSVIFKPAQETVLVAWIAVNLLWKAGVDRELLQFVVCEDEPVGSLLIKDPRINSVVLTGATSTAKSFLKMRPGLDLKAETGGKNAIIVTALADRDLAIKDIVHSAFGHSGQKCSACSLAILEAEVYEDPHFLEQLRDAAKSLKVGSAWDFGTMVNPLIHYPNGTLHRALTTLDPGEEWLLKPEQDSFNPNLWSPGIKLGVVPGSFMHQNELFGPVLAVMRADNLTDAISIVNGTRYGLTSGLQSLDPREQDIWVSSIQAGNCYINRGITGAIVQRQPFGGCKESSFGSGSKAGGPNYLMQFMHARQRFFPSDLEFLYEEVENLEQYLPNEDKDLWDVSVGSYAFYWIYYFSRDHDPSEIIGQDNILRYVPQENMVLRVQAADSLFDVMRVVAAAITCGTEIQVSGSSQYAFLKNVFGVVFVEESEELFVDRVDGGNIRRVRLLSEPSSAMKNAFSQRAVNVILAPVMANGRLEIVHYLREVSLSVDYHRYGNLGIREHEARKSLAAAACCGGSCCCS